MSKKKNKTVLIGKEEVKKILKKVRRDEYNEISFALKSKQHINKKKYNRNHEKRNF